MLKRSIGIAGLVLVLSLGCIGAAAAGQAEIIKSMAAFDRVFIPSLAMTNMEKVGPSTKAIAKLKELWAGFAADYGKAMPNDSEWAGDIEMTSEAIDRAYQSISKDKDCEGAHQALEEVRFNTLQMRTRNKIPYYLDYLNQYHEAMEPLVHDFAQKTPADLKAEDFEGLKKSAIQAQNVWKTAAQAPFDAQAWGFKPGQVEKLKTIYAKGEKNFSALQKALDAGDAQAAAASIKQVKPIYSQAFKLFGDFKQFTN